MTIHLNCNRSTKPCAILSPVYGGLAAVIGQLVRYLFQGDAWVIPETIKDGTVIFAANFKEKDGKEKDGKEMAIEVKPNGTLISVSAE